MEKEVEERLIEFFTRVVDAEDFAKSTRRFMYETIRMVLETDEDHIHRDWITDGHYWLTALCETLDPQLEDL